MHVHQLRKRGSALPLAAGLPGHLDHQRDSCGGVEEGWSVHTYRQRHWVSFFLDWRYYFQLQKNGLKKDW
jgi:hypothetical protein